MAILRLKEIRGMSPAEREKRLEELHAEITRARALRTGGGTIESPGRIKELRKTVARIITITREEELKKKGG
ncbi:MAG: 50S ribosomal protein L29 [Candidatus Atabeyarchaeum deiterrae]|jgi:large subunit ribosomal protein L29